jgi:hypothetical protein
MLFAVYIIYWTEYESGWGQRPDGVSYHKSLDEAKEFGKVYGEQGNRECFSRGSQPTLIEVSKTYYDFIHASPGNGVWNHNLPK